MRGASLTRRVCFTATHRYWRPDWDAAKNQAIFGACAAPEPHGHDYACDVTVGGTIDSHTGMVLDLGVLDAILDEEVVNPLHGHSLNDVVPEFRAGRLIPTCEELARLIAVRLTRALEKRSVQALVQSVRVAEDASLSATWIERG